MSNNKSKEPEKIVIDTNKLRMDAGKRLDTTKVNKQSGMISLNEGDNLGIGQEFFTKGERNNKTD